MTTAHVEAPAVEARDVGFVFHNPPIEALASLTFQLGAGTFTAVMGPNGSGKTTLLRLMMGLIAPSAGRISLMGHDPVAAPDVVQRLVGYVPQYESINSRLPVRSRDIVELGVAARTGGRLSRSDVRSRTVRALDAVGLADIANQRYGSLSGGQRQRVLIARALAVDPDVLILDEPFSAMDIASQQSTAELLHRLVQSEGMTVITVVHNVNAIVHFVDAVLLMNRRVISIGAPNDVLRPEPLQRAFGATVPVIICEEGFSHPLMEDVHG